MEEGRGLDPQRLRRPIAFHAMPAARPVDLPCWRSGEVLISTPCGAHRFQNGLGVLTDYRSMLVFSGGLEPPTSRFGDECSSV
jgi:hypothetical protein